MNIYQKLIEVRKVVPYLQKEATGAQYKYVGSSQVLGNVKSKMDEMQLLLVPRITGHKLLESAIEYKDTNGNVTKRTTTYFTEIDMTMTWINAEKPDETIECSWYGQGVDIAGEKGLGKALTYGEKYFMLKFFNIATDKDDPDSFQKKYEDEPEPPKAQSKQTNPAKAAGPPQPFMDKTMIEDLYILAAKKGYSNDKVVNNTLKKYNKTVELLTAEEYHCMTNGFNQLPDK